MVLGIGVAVAVITVGIAIFVWRVLPPNPVGRSATAESTRIPDAILAWPGSDDVRAGDDSGTFTGNLSGLAIESAQANGQAILWAVQNDPATLFRLVETDGRWLPSSQMSLRFPNGTGKVDAEGVTLGGSSHAGIYVASERDDAVGKVSRNSILRYAPGVSSRPLVATHEWDVTSALRPVRPNSGIESIAWVPDSALVATRLLDEATRRPYAPAAYPEHGMGVFLVGLESDGTIHAFTLDHVRGSFTRLASFSSGHPNVMALDYDRDTGLLYATCDDSCANRISVLEVVAGRFVVRQRYAPPSTLPNANHEGFAVTTAAQCVDGRKRVFWADDSRTNGHSIRAATIPCDRAWLP